MTDLASLALDWEELNSTRGPELDEDESEDVLSSLLAPAALLLSLLAPCLSTTTEESPTVIVDPDLSFMSLTWSGLFAFFPKLSDQGNPTEKKNIERVFIVRRFCYNEILHIPLQYKRTLDFIFGLWNMPYSQLWSNHNIGSSNFQFMERERERAPWSFWDPVAAAGTLFLVIIILFFLPPSWSGGLLTNHENMYNLTHHSLNNLGMAISNRLLGWYDCNWLQNQ